MNENNEQQAEKQNPASASVESGIKKRLLLLKADTASPRIIEFCNRIFSKADILGGGMEYPGVS